MGSAYDQAHGAGLQLGPEFQTVEACVLRSRALVFMYVSFNAGTDLASTRRSRRLNASVRNGEFPTWALAVRSGVAHSAKD